MQSDGKPRRGIAPTLPTHLSLDQLEGCQPVCLFSQRGAVHYSPGAGGQVHFLRQRQLADKSNGLLVCSTPVARAGTPWGRVAGGRFEDWAIVVVVEWLLLLSLCQWLWLLLGLRRL